METTWNGKKLHVINIHLKANFLVPEKTVEGKPLPMPTQITAADGLIRSEVFRFSQAKRVRELVDSLFEANPDAYILIGGDFNAEENYATFRIIQGVLPGASDTLVEAGLDIEPARRFSSLSTTMGRKRLLDHFLLSKGLSSHLKNIQILNENISENINKTSAPTPTLVETDHAPVAMELN